MRAIELPFLLGALVVQSTDSVLENGGFSDWKGGLPGRWESSVGARSKDGPLSTLGPLADGGLRLEGDGSTGSWRYLVQSFDAGPGRTFSLEFETRLRGSRMDPGQFSSHFVALSFYGAGGERLGRSYNPVPSEEWSTSFLSVVAPEGTVRASADVFLAHSGRLEVRHVRVEELRAEDSFELLVRDMDRCYSHFELKAIDWTELTERYRPRLDGELDAGKFVAALREMLAELKDQHVWIEAPGGEIIPTFQPAVEPNYDHRAVVALLRDWKQLDRIGLVGRTTEHGLGYVAIGDFMGPDESYVKLETAIRELFDAPAILIDIRNNAGGNEVRAQRIAGLFTEQETPYALSRWRSGPGHAAFTEPVARGFTPNGERSFMRPVLCLIGPDAVSTGECFAMMMKALPHARLAGRTTRGASGNPAPVALPNGVTVYYSRWLGLELDGAIVEGRGIHPDLELDHEGPGDPTFEAGVQELARGLR